MVGYGEAFYSATRTLPDLVTSQIFLHCSLHEGSTWYVGYRTVWVVDNGDSGLRAVKVLFEVDCEEGRLCNWAARLGEGSSMDGRVT
jgi:hypothetical protein